MKGERESDEKWERVDEAAVDWVIKRERGFTPQEQDAFMEWLASDPMHGERFARHGRSWLESNLLAEWRPEHSDRPNPDLLARKSTRVTWFKPLWMWSAAAAALLVLAFVLLEPLKEATPNGRDVTWVSSERYAYQNLEDGSEIDLNDGAELIIDYTDDQRLIELKSGEAHFTVSKDPDRPFVVRVGSAEIRAIGTAFNVRREPDLLEILVTEGQVVWQLHGDEPDVHFGSSVPRSREIAAGYRSVIHWDQAVFDVPKVEKLGSDEIERILKWKPVMLQFKGTPLSEAIGEFNRRNETQIILKDEALADLSIVASIRSNRIDYFIRLLELTLKIESRKTEEGVIHLYAKG